MIICDKCGSKQDVIGDDRIFKGEVSGHISLGSGVEFIPHGKNDRIPVMVKILTTGGDLCLLCAYEIIKKVVEGKTNA